MLDLKGKLLIQRITYNREENTITFEEFNINRRIIPFHVKWIYEYNNKDLLIKETAYNILGDINRINIWEYNDRDLMIKSLNYGTPSNPRNNPEGHPHVIETYKYYDNDLLSLAERNTYNNEGELETKHITKYTDTGLKIEEYFYKDQSNKLCCVGVYEYNDKNLLIKSVEYNNKGKLDIMETYEYDDKGLLKERKVVDCGELRKHIYDHNSQELLINEEVYDTKNKMIQKFEYVYNDKGLLIEKTKYDDEHKIIYKERYQQNDNDLLIKETHYNSLDEPIEAFITEYKSLIA
jgi:hypothetical protein